MIGITELVLLLLALELPSLAVLVDILRSEFSGNNKLVWTVVVLALPLMGSLFYLLIGRRQKVAPRTS